MLFLFCIYLIFIYYMSVSSELILCMSVITMQLYIYLVESLFLKSIAIQLGKLWLYLVPAKFWGRERRQKKKNSLPLLASRSSPILKDARRKPDLIAWSDWSTPLNDLFFLSFHEVQTMHKIAALQAFFLYFPSKESSC